MIRYLVQCRNQHRFEGWFRNAATFDEQASRGDIACPECGDTSIARAPMAPSVRTSDRAAHAHARDQAAAADDKGGKDAGAGESDASPSNARARAFRQQVMRELVKLRDHVESTGENVGNRFAEEARKIHYGETEARTIYGQTTDAEASALDDEGIGFARIPWLRRTDS